jgi:hypothetical protein
VHRLRLLSPVTGTFVSTLQSEQSALDDLRLPAPAIGTQSDSGHSVTKRALAGLSDLRTRTAQLSLVVGVVGATLALTGTIWAIQLQVSYPIAMMAGYCTLVASACLAIAVSGLQKPAVPQELPVPTKPDISGAWKLVDTFSVSDACRLLCDIEPGSMVTQDSIAWARALLDAIERGELSAVEKPRIGLLAPRDHGKPNWHTEITRDALKSWAQSRDLNPQSLKD